MKYHILKDQDGTTYRSEHEYDTRLEATRQANALNEELDGKAHCYVLDDLELVALMAGRRGADSSPASSGDALRCATNGRG